MDRSRLVRLGPLIFNWSTFQMRGVKKHWLQFVLLWSHFSKYNFRHLMQIGIYVTKRSLIREDDIIITFNDVIKVDVKKEFIFHFISIAWNWKSITNAKEFFNLDFLSISRQRQDSERERGGDREQKKDIWM